MPPRSIRRSAAGPVRRSAKTLSASPGERAPARPSQRRVQPFRVKPGIGSEQSRRQSSAKQSPFEIGHAAASPFPRQHGHQLHGTLSPRQAVPEFMRRGQGGGAGGQHPEFGEGHPQQSSESGSGPAVEALRPAPPALCRSIGRNSPDPEGAPPSLAGRSSKTPRRRGTSQAPSFRIAALR